MAQQLESFSEEPYDMTERQRRYRRQQRSEWKDANPDKVEATNRKFHLQKKYGLTIEEYQELLSSQNHRCAACGDLFRSTPHIDHNHTTGEVRGLLCSGCNRGMGFCHEDPTRLRLLADYIERFRGV